MAIPDKLQHFLEDNHALYEHTVHPQAYTARDVARAEHVPAHEIAKSIVFHTEQGYGLAVLPADCDVDLQELRAGLGVSHLRLAAEHEIATLFPDTELGAMPPFGNLYGLPVYADAGLLGMESIAFNGGTHRDSVHMKTADFRRLARPVVLSFSRVH